MSMNERSLREITSKGTKLEGAHIHSFHELLTKGMRSKERINALRCVNINNINKLAGEWYGGRIFFTPQGDCRYVAGQDYTAEIKYIREEIIKKVKNREI